MYPQERELMQSWQGIALTTLLLWGCSTALPPTARWFVNYQAPSTRPVLPGFGDEFAELDDPEPQGSRGHSSDTITLEHARAYYLHALQLLEHGDTARAVAALERALSLLDQLATSPIARRSEEFSELVQSILEDYQTYARPRESSTDFFFVRDRLLKALDRSEAEQHLAPLSAISLSAPIAGSLEAVKTIIPLPRNEFVQRALDFLTQDRGRRFMQRWLQRSGRFFPMMRRIIREENLPDELVYLPMIESGLNPFAVSWAGAVGLWQFIRSTGELYGLRVTTWIDERRDPEKSTRAALRHLRDLYTEFGDWHLALAAYNCGAQAVRRALVQAQRNLLADSAPTILPKLSFWDIRDYLPRETRNYVPLYIATTLIALNPRAFGFSPEEIVPEPELIHDTYELTEPMSLATIARCLGIGVDSLQQLNPELLTLSTPPDISPYPLKIPLGSRPLLQQCLLTLSPSEKRPWITHVVRRGETLSEIATRYGVPVAEIYRLNRLGRRLRPGTSLRIPVGLASAATTASPKEAPPSVSSQSIPTGRPRYHIVRRGQTLSQIADIYNVSIADLKAWNRLRSDRIRVGQRLRISPSGTVASTPASSSLSYVLHRVRRGETAYSIAQRYGVTVAQLQQWNPESFRGEMLLAGTTLRIPVQQGSSTLRRSARTYTVRAGDTLLSIARRFGISVEELREHNGLEGDYIRVGQHLQIPD